VGSYGGHQAAAGKLNTNKYKGHHAADSRKKTGVAGHGPCSAGLWTVGNTLAAACPATLMTPAGSV
jgi:hypothetical protein